MCEAAAASLRNPPPPPPLRPHPPCPCARRYAAHMAGSFVLLCAVDDEDGDWDVGELATVGLAVFVGDTPFRNTLDRQRVDILQDRLGADDTLVDRNAVFLPAVCITPLLAPSSGRPAAAQRTVTYADFMNAARPDSIHVRRPAAVTPEVYVLCYNVSHTLQCTTVGITEPWIHAKALVHMVSRYKDEWLTTSVSKVAETARCATLGAVHEYLVRPAAAATAAALQLAQFPLLTKFSCEKVLEKVLTRQFTAPQRLAELAGRIPAM